MIHIFLPAFNEEIALPLLVRKFHTVLKDHSEPYRILVYDDGSADHTYKRALELAKEYPLEALRHEVNQGLGETLRDGFEYLIPKLGDGDKVVTLDCDDTHEPQYLMGALAKLEANNDVVILSRFSQGGGQEGLSGIKTMMSMGAGIFLKIFFPLKGIREYSCNYRVFRASILKKALVTFGKEFIQLTHLGFVAAPEILIKMRMIHARIAEVPFVLRYDQKPTQSTNVASKTILGYFALTFKYWGRRVK